MFDNAVIVQNGELEKTATMLCYGLSFTEDIDLYVSSSEYCSLHSKHRLHVCCAWDWSGGGLSLFGCESSPISRNVRSSVRASVR